MPNLYIIIQDNTVNAEADESNPQTYFTQKIIRSTK